MDWQQLIDQFKPLKAEEVMMFAPPRELEQAVNTYNHAIFNVGHNSMDIALIALRKLTATYPMFAHATLLLGCCQAMLGLYDEALELFDHALLSGLPDDWQDQAQRMRDEAASQRTLRAGLLTNGNGGGNGSLNEASNHARRQASIATVLEKSRRHGKIRLASEKERKSVIRQGEFPDEEPTKVHIKKDTMEYLRIAIPAAAALLVVVLLVLAGIRWLPGLVKDGQNRKAETARLQWLTEHLNGLSVQDPAVAGLLQDYEAYFTPTPTPKPTTPSTAASDPAVLTSQSSATPAATTAATAATAAMPTAAATAAPTVGPAATTTGVPTANAAAESLRQVGVLYEQAASLQTTDLRTAGDNLLTARELLAAIPAQTTTPSVTGDAASVSQNVEALITKIGRDAAEYFRVSGMEQFDLKNYEAALGFFLKAYRLYPRAYGGGVAYYCGRCYQLLDNKDSARQYFDYVVTNFAGKDIAVSAAARLKELG